MGHPARWNHYDPRTNHLCAPFGASMIAPSKVHRMAGESGELNRPLGRTTRDESVAVSLGNHDQRQRISDQSKLSTTVLRVAKNDVRTIACKSNEPISVVLAAFLTKIGSILLHAMVLGLTLIFLKSLRRLYARFPRLHTYLNSRAYLT